MTQEERQALRDQNATSLQEAEKRNPVKPGKYQDNRFSDDNVRTMREQALARHRARIIDRLGMRPEHECAKPYTDTTDELERFLLLTMQND